MPAASRELLRAQVSAALAKATVRPIVVAGVELFVRGLTGAERVQLQKWAAEAQGGGEPLSDYKVAFLGLCDADGVRLFEDEGSLAVLDGSAVSEIARAVIEASGLTAEAAEIAKGN
jgi:hypothetical protein